ncbi:Sec-independent protein translocase protein TatB [Kiloniella litopenaei]|uniref:Sec-independent protein translocase protein TatB n=1 Tax=Kiloniella litopenaei TaxID=1549748 RepID=UPI000697ADDB|nr:Sec-independent protein translocase protein TatB [Kiloniella litopenaei]
MFDIGWSEMMVVAVLTLLIMGPKELPNTLRNVSKWVRKAKGLAREFQSGVDEVIRESDLQDARKALEGANSESIRKTVEDVIDPTQALTKTTQEVKDGVEAITKEDKEDHNPFASVQKPLADTPSATTESVKTSETVKPEAVQVDNTTSSKSS